MKLDMELTSIGDASSAADWVKQSRDKELERNRRLAEERRRQYEEQLRAAEEADEEIAESAAKRTGSRTAYSSSDLRGMRVMHGSEAFDNDREVILTLADTSVLATDEHGKVLGMNADDTDILENVHLTEAERREDRQRRLQQLRRGAYSGYDDDEFAEGAVPGAKRSILAHYDKERKAGPRLTLGDEGVVSSAAAAAVAASHPMGSDGGAIPEDREFVSLKVAMKPASSFLTLAEVKARKGRLASRRVAKRVRTGEEDEQEGEEAGGFDLASLAPQAPAESAEANGSSAMEVVAPEVKEVKPVSRRLIRPAVGELEQDEDLSAALARARSLAVRRNLLQQSLEESQEAGDSGAKTALTLLQRAGVDSGSLLPSSTGGVGESKEEEDDEHDTEGRRADGKIVFNSTVEFSTRLQATLNERARLRAENAVRDAEGKAREEATGADEGEGEGEGEDDENSEGDSSMSMEEGNDSEREDDQSVDSQLAFLHAQPTVNKGVASALALFRETGDLRQREELAGRAKDSRTVDPSVANEGVKIEYRDEFGRKLTQKEAFRQLSYRFHGYGQGKKKREKTLKAMAAKKATLSSRTGILDGEAGVMKSLTTAQEATGKAHIVVQGGVHASHQQIATLAAQMAKSKEAKEKKAKKSKTA